MNLVITNLSVTPVNAEVPSQLQVGGGEIGGRSWSVAVALPGSLVLPRCPKISAAKGFLFHTAVYYYTFHVIYLNHKAAYPKPYPRNCP